MPTGIYKRTKEIKEKLSQSHIGITSGMLGKKHSEETKKKMSIKKTGKRPYLITDSTRLKMSLSKIGKRAWNSGLKTGPIKDISNMKGRKLSDITKQKISQSLKGSNHYRWIEDRTLLKTDRNKAYNTKYKYWMLEVKKRDNWKCKINNKDCNGSLEAHHILNWIEHPELRYEINNGITLCHAHHPRKRAEEKRLSPYFMELVSVSK